MPLDPRSAAWLAMLNRIDAPCLHEMPVDTARRSYDKLMYAYRGEPQLVASVEPQRLARRDFEGGDLVARLYRPHLAGEKGGAILWLHGGGWALGSLFAYDAWCRALAEATGRAVLALEYRLAPENRFPAGVDDAWFALGWLFREATTLGLDPARIALAGDSAGATLAAVLALQARDAGGPVPDHQVLIYPATDMTADTPSGRRYAAGYFLEQETRDWFAAQYFDSPTDAFDWRASPALAADHAGLPPALIINAECDPLADDGTRYAALLRAAGVPTRHLRYAGMVHGFATMFSLFAESRAVLAAIAKALALPGTDTPHPERVHHE